MNRTLIVTSLALVISLQLSAQQTGDSMRDYTINGIGAGGTSPVANQALTPGVLNQSYSTQDPSMPLLWVAGTIQIGGIFRNRHRRVRGWTSAQQATVD